MTETATVSAERVADGRVRILSELRKVIVCQDDVVAEVLTAVPTPATVAAARPGAERGR